MISVARNLWQHVRGRETRGGGPPRDREDLADDEPVAEHADRGQVLLHGRDRPGVRPGCRRATWGGDTSRKPEASRLGPPKELPDGPRQSRAPCRTCRPRGVGLRVLAGQGAQIDTTTAAGRLVFGIFAALVEFERELIRERTVAGLKAARARERKGGRRSFAS